MARNKQPAKNGLTVSGSGESGLPAGYPDLLNEVKQRISQSRVRAALSVNRELIQLYWEIGRLIVQRQERERWGRSVIHRLSLDIRQSFDGISGFSPSNLWRMRSFYLAYAQGVTNLAQAVREIDTAADSNPGGGHAPNLAQAVRDSGKAESICQGPDDLGQVRQQPVSESSAPDLPQAVAEIPWGHNTVLVEKVKNLDQRLWYAQKTTEHGWSRAVLIHQIESDLYGRQGEAITNFEQTLPAPQSDLARQLLKDPYTFEFLGLADDVRERELENALTAHIQRVLLELGKGFAFVGRQYLLEVAGDDYLVDLLFYHLHLRCFVAVDLKVECFKPEFVGKMNFYLAAIDDLLRHESDQPSIGLILCKDRNRVVVEYALRDSTRPLGVATYKLLPSNLQENLPSPEELAEALENGNRPVDTTEGEA